MGYKTSSALINLSSITFLLVVLVGLASLTYLSRKMSQEGPSKTQCEKIGCSSYGPILFADLMFLIVTFCCTISIYVEDRDGGSEGETNYQVAIAVLCATTLFLFGFYGYFVWQAKTLETQAVKKRFGAVFENLSLKPFSGRLSLSYQLFTLARRISLAFVMTFAKWSLLGQLLFMNFCSTLCIGIICHVRPYASKADNRLELFTEFTILLLYSLCLTQTDYVSDPEGRNVSGWLIIGLISLFVITTFGYLLF